MSKRILITAGPTHEPIDPVRYIANRSSGKTGIAIARAARDAGWLVTLLLGPVARAKPRGITTRGFETCAQLQRLLADHLPTCDVLVMAAAVADYRPAIVAEKKIGRAADRLALELTPTPDLVAECCSRKRSDQWIVGFALEESATLDERAREKLRRKGLDAIVANPLDTMGSDRIRARILTPSGDVVEPLDRRGVDKPTFARFFVEWLDAVRSESH